MTIAANASILAAYDFGRFGTIVDVGGGNGALLAAFLSTYPNLSGVLFDQAHVVATADEVLREAGVADRCRIESGSFCDAVPAGADAYVLKFILHDWEDEEVEAILRPIRRAVAAGGALLVIERLFGAGDDATVGFADLNMLVMPGGQERTLEEYGSLFAAAGFGLVRATPTAAGLHVIEAAPT